MQVIAIIQARMGSTRFPGKSMHEIQGKPSLEHLLDSVSQCRGLAGIHLATSTNSEDQPIVDFASSYGVQAYRGHPTNVASRFLKIVSTTNCSHFIRLNGDSPLLDYRKIEQAIDLAKCSPDSIISSTFERTLPSGMSIELIPAHIFKDCFNKFSEDEDLEHVTRYFYRHCSNFDVLPLPSNLENPASYSFSFDTQEDLEVIEKVFEKLSKPHHQYTLKEKCKIYKSLLLT